MSSKDFDNFCKLADDLKSQVSKNPTPAIRESRLDEAYNLYGKAAEQAVTRDQRKKVLESLQDVIQSQIVFYTKNLDYCTNYWDKVANLVEKFSFWRSKLLFKTIGNSNHVDFQSLEKNFVKTLDKFEKFIALDRKPLDINLIIYASLTKGADRNALGYKLYMAYAWVEFLFKKGIEASETENDLESAQKFFKEVYTPLEEAQNSIDRSKRIDGMSAVEKEWIKKWDDELKIKREEVSMETKRVESKLLLKLAEERHQILMFENETLDEEEAIDVYDIYQQILTKSQNFDVEMEALALSKMGFYHLRVLHFDNSKEKAREYFSRSIQLALSLEPKNVREEEWFKKANDFLRELQNKQLKAEHVQLQLERKEFEEELAELDEFLKKNVRFQEELKSELSDLVSKYKPKGRHDIQIIQETTNNRKLVMKLIKWYHPDNNRSEGDKLWTLICEDITSYLNRILEKVKTE